jgi:hypothetical protein
MPFRRAAGVAVLAVALALTGSCSDDEPDTASVRPAPGAVSPTVASTAPSTAPSPDGSSTGSELAKGPPYERKSGPSGSGCTPPVGSSLPAGWWAGKIKNVNGTSFDFDVVCWFTGQAAIKAGGEDDAGPVEDDYYVRNSEPSLHSESFVSGAAPATCVGDANEPFACTVGDVLALYASGRTTGTIKGREVTAFSTAWLHVTGDTADYLYMQFTP